MKLYRYVYLLLFLWSTLGAKQYPGNVSGFVRDKYGNVLDSVLIEFESKNEKTFSDSSGVYSFENIIPGSYTLKASKKGYTQSIAFSIVVKPRATAYVNFTLTLKIEELEKMVVHGTSVRTTKKVSTSQHSMDRHQIANQPAGAYDIQRALSTLPSFAGGFDESNDIIVIGGNYGENCFVIDGIEVFNPNHFSSPTGSGGVLSVINPSLVEKMDFFAGAFPAHFGQKVSSVLSLHLRDGTIDRFHGKVDLGVAGFGGTIEGPLPKGSYLFTAHRSFLNLIYKILDDELTIPPAYTNMVTKIKISPHEKHQLSLLGIYGSDKSGEKGPTWNFEYKGNQNILGIVHEFYAGVSSLKSNISFIRQEINTNEYNNNGINNYHNNQKQSAYALKSDYSTRLFDRIEFDAGVAGKHLTFDHYRWYIPDTIWLYDTIVDTQITVFKINPSLQYDKFETFCQASGYIQSAWPIAGIVTPAAGIRTNYYQFTHEKTFSPRASVTFHLPGYIDISLAYGRPYQPPNSYDLFRHPANISLKSKFSDQVVFGVSYKPRDDLAFKIEGFYKRYRDIPISEAQCTPDPLDWSQRFVNKGKSRTIGGDIFIEKQLKKNIWGSLSYSYAESKWYDPRDPSILFYADLDYRHHVSTLIGYRKRYREEKWYQNLRTKIWYNIIKYLPFVPTDESDYSVRWRFLGGRPYTPKYYDKSLHRWTVYPTATYNSKRMTPYSRLDFHLKERIFQRKISFWTYMEALNILDHKNLFWFLYRDDTAEIVKRYQIPRVVMGGIIVEF